MDEQTKSKNTEHSVISENFNNKEPEYYGLHPTNTIKHNTLHRQQLGHGLSTSRQPIGFPVDESPITRK